jgi:hypothetical protein
MNVIERIAAEISGQNAYDLTAEITRYHRAPGSGGYHAATKLVRDRLIANGLSVEETRYPLDGSTVILDRTMPLAWEAHGAKVSVISPGANRRFRARGLMHRLVVDRDPRRRRGGGVGRCRHRRA